MKIGVELEFFICHKSDETFYMPDIISRYLKYNSGFISMQKDSNGICIKAKNELGVTISFEFTLILNLERTLFIRHQNGCLTKNCY